MKEKYEHLKLQIIEFLATKLKLPTESFIELGRGYQNIIFKCSMGDDEYIIRISDASTRTRSEIECEINFLIHLKSFNVDVSQPKTIINDQYITEYDFENRQFYIVIFNKASGSHISYPEYLNDKELFFNLGVITGRLHKASELFQSNYNNRKNWEENYYLKNRDVFIPITESEKRNAINDQILKISKLSSEQYDFGLIHGDINPGNFFVDGESITLFDFDECQNSWYIEDIAIQLFYTVYVFGDDDIEERNQKSIDFMQNFLKGYRTRREIKLESLKLITDFLVLREMIVHIGIYKKWDLNQLSPWARNYFNESSKRIISRKPIIEFNDAWNDEY